MSRSRHGSNRERSRGIGLRILQVAVRRGLLVWLCAAFLVSCKSGRSGPTVDSAPFLPVDVVASNLVLVGGLVYAAAGKSGLAIIDPATRTLLKLVPPPSGSGSVDDVAFADGKLFVLDARSPGFLSVFGLVDPRNPALADGPISAPVGPYAGVSAAKGLVIVSGGTDELTLWTYSAAGKLGSETATTDLGRGQPDVLISADGRLGFVSTHIEGDDFGLTILELADPPGLVTLGQLLIPGAGFTGGTAEPASFPIVIAVLDVATLVVAYGSGLAVIDIADPSSPSIARVVDIGIEASSVAVFGRVAFVVGCVPAPMLVVVDLVDASQPTIVTSLALPTDGRPTGIDADKDVIAIATNGGGVLILDRTNPVPPNPPTRTP